MATPQEYSYQTFPSQRRCLASNLRASWAEAQSQRAEEEEEESRRSLAEIGAAHREADNYVAEVAAATPPTEKAALLQTALKRGDEALRKIAEVKREAREEEEIRKAYKEKALAKEQERAKRIASLPAPGEGCK